MNDPKNAHPYPAQGNNQGPPVAAPPQYPNYSAPRPPKSSSHCLEGCIAIMCFFCLLDGCFCDPSSLCCC